MMLLPSLRGYNGDGSDLSSNKKHRIQEMLENGKINVEMKKTISMRESEKEKVNIIDFLWKKVDSRSVIPLWQGEEGLSGGVVTGPSLSHIHIYRIYLFIHLLITENWPIFAVSTSGRMMVRFQMWYL